MEALSATLARRLDVSRHFAVAVMSFLSSLVFAICVWNWESTVVG